MTYVNAQPPGTLQGLFASAKAAVILNLAVERGLELDRFTCFYDDAEEKWGHTVPGTEIPIRPMRMIEEADRRVILFESNLEALITQRFPELKVISVENIFEGH